MLKHVKTSFVSSSPQSAAARSRQLLPPAFGIAWLPPGSHQDSPREESRWDPLIFWFGPVLSQATPGQSLLMDHDGGRCQLKLQMYVALFQAIQQSNLNVWGCWVPTFSRCCTLSARQTTLKYPEKPRVLLLDALDAGDLNSGWKTLLNRHATIKVLPPFVLRKQSQEHTLLLHGWNVA